MKSYTYIVSQFRFSQIYFQGFKSSLGNMILGISKMVLGISLPRAYGNIIFNRYSTEYHISTYISSLKATNKVLMFC